MATPTVCETRWKEVLNCYENKHDELLAGHPDCREEIGLVLTAIIKIGQLIHTSPPVNGNGAVWKELVARAEAEITVLSKHLDGNALFTGILCLYAAIHREMAATLQTKQVETEEEFREQKRRKRNLSDKQTKQKRKTDTKSGTVSAPHAELTTKNFCAPLRTEMDLEGDKVNTVQNKQGTTTQAGRQPPIILTSATNLLQLQKSISGIIKGSFEFRKTRNGTRVLTKEMVDYSAIKSFFLQSNLKFYTFFPKSLKPIKA
jgi:hypothetical protein